MEIRSFQDSPEIVNATESNKEDGFLRWVTGYIPSINTKKHKLNSKKKKTKEDKVSSSDSDESATFGSELRSPPISETQLDPVRKVGFWKRRRLSFRTARTQAEPGVNDAGAGVIEDGDRKLGTSSSLDSTRPITRQVHNEPYVLLLIL